MTHTIIVTVSNGFLRDVGISPVSPVSMRKLSRVATFLSLTTYACTCVTDTSHVYLLLLRNKAISSAGTIVWYEQFDLLLMCNNIASLVLKKQGQTFFSRSTWKAILRCCASSSTPTFVHLDHLIAHGYGHV